MNSNDDQTNDPFAEFTPKPAATAADAAATAIGGVIFGAVVGAACAYFWKLDYLIAAGIGGVIGGLAGLVVGSGEVVMTGTATATL